MFAVWRRKVKERIEKGTLQITLEEFKNIGVRDMMGDMKAHSIRNKTRDRSEELKQAFENIPAAQLKGVPTWYNHLAREPGEKGCEYFEPMLVDISCRRKTADRYVSGFLMMCWKYLSEQPMKPLVAALLKSNIAKSSGFFCSRALVCAGDS